MDVQLLAGDVRAIAQQTRQRVLAVESQGIRINKIGTQARTKEAIGATIEAKQSITGCSATHVQYAAVKGELKVSYASATHVDGAAAGSVQVVGNAAAAEVDDTAVIGISRLD